MSYFYSVDVLGAWVSVEGLMGDREEVPSFVPFSFIQGDAQLKLECQSMVVGLGGHQRHWGFWSLKLTYFITILKKNKF